jgi:hypothetical protein
MPDRKAGSLAIFAAKPDFDHISENIDVKREFSIYMMP